MIAKLPDQLESLPEVSEFLKSFGRSIALSKMCAVDSESQGEVIAMEVLLTGKSPRQIGLEMSERYNMMHGKLATKSEAMLSDFIHAGGKHKIVTREENASVVQMSFNDDVQTFGFTWEKAQKEPYVYEGKEADVLAKLENGGKGLKIKAKYATPRSRMQMLWNRVISDGVRAMAPHVTRGAYTPDELADVIEADGFSFAAGVDNDEPATETAKPANGKSKATKSTTDAKPSEVKSADTANVNAKDSDYPATDTQATSPDGFATAEQSSAIKSLFERLGIDHDRQVEILAKRNVTAVRSLTVEQAALLIQNLQQIEKQRQATTAKDDTPTSMAVDGPCTDELEKQLKDAISAAMQSGMKGLAKEIGEHLKANGLAKIKDMCFADARDMLKAVEARSITAFFDTRLRQFDADGNEIPF